jgi:Plasmid encoded RepA protein
MQEEGQQLSLWERSLLQASASEEGYMDVSFLHKGFCIAGLPLRRPKEDAAVWSRQDGRFSLTVEPARLVMPNGARIDIGVPYGPKARLLAMWLATEARDHRKIPGDRWIEMGRITEWLRAVGLPVTGGERGSIGPTKEQLLRLAFCNFTMLMKGDNSAFFQRETLIEAGAFRDSDFQAWISGRPSDMRWPEGLMLSHNAYERFTRHSIPIPTMRLRQVSNNAMAIDILAYLCYRLPMIGPKSTEILRWQDLTAQFGSGEKFSSHFKRAVSESIRKTLDAYPEANVEMTSEGLLLRHSDPAYLRKAFVAIPGAKLTRRTKGQRSTPAAKAVNG